MNRQWGGVRFGRGERFLVGWCWFAGERGYVC